ncbi:phospholipase D-like domain-containing protein [Marinimicrobium sp. C2-29]|uniref:phospholipase D-like domain-containing protein n=1 Tax=Marinimicrobium sp. C2-29 TaxID=3139825 RepID=UPI0031398684
MTGFFSRPWKSLGRLLLLLLAVLVVVSVYHIYKPLPPGLDFQGPARPVRDVRFLADITYTDAAGERRTEQHVFDEVFDMIDRAERFILVDMFLFNDFQGEVPETHRRLSTELTDRLIRQKREHPGMEVRVITDPINTVYGGRPAEHLERLEAAGISVTLTDLTRLRDSNPLYSGFWRLLVQPWGNSREGWLPNPFGEGEVSLRSYLALLNFKANHRKLIIADQGKDYVALVTSANPHDGSSAHGNVALRFDGPAVADLLQSEQAVLKFSGGPGVQEALPPPGKINQASTDSLSLLVLTERAVERVLLDMIERVEAGDRLDLAVFYLSDRDIVQALLRARERGAQLRVLLDPNKDAFGRIKDGVPNRPVAHELAQGGIDIRWCATTGEQCHAKWLQARYADGRAAMILGSSNFTRRNLHNLNLETGVRLAGPADAESMLAATDWFERRWHNRENRQFSVDYPVYADSSLWLRLKYRVMEATGLSTF